MTASLTDAPMAAVSSPDTRAPRAARLSWWLTRTTAFLAGFQIMVLEVAGLRVLQEFLGSSVVVTGTTLALVMVILALGYAVGGRIARPIASGLVLSGALAVAGLYGQFIAVALCEAIASWGLSLREQLQSHPLLRSIVPAALVFGALYGLPTFLLGAVTPYLIGSSNAERSVMGVEAGTIMAVSALGSIAGTAFGSYLAIPVVGVERAVASASAVLLAMAAVSLAIHWKSSRVMQLAVLLGAPFIAVGSCTSAVALSSEVRDAATVYQAESHYGHLRVAKRSDRSGREVLAYHPSRLYMHSLLHPSEPLRETRSLMFLVPGLVSPPRDILVLGSAAGGILRRIEVAFPEAHVVGVDIDPAVHELAVDIFGVDTRQSQLVTSDARLFLVDDERSYDFIIVDLFAGEFIPTHCLSLEFFQLVARKLRPHGAVFLNTNMNDVPFEVPAGAEPFRPIRHLQSTLRAAGFSSLFENAFFHSVFAFREQHAIGELRSTLIEALRRTELLPPLRVGAGVAAFTTAEVPSWGDRYRPLTDDWMPTMLLERKSNDDAIYAALGQAAAAEGASMREVPSEIERPLLEEYLLARPAPRRTLSRPGPLYAKLNEVDDARVPVDVDVAARLFRFSREQEPSAVVPANAWARLAAAYSEIYALGRNDEQERLLDVLLAATASLDRGFE